MSIMSTITDVPECGICKYPYGPTPEKTPRNLECGHSVCEQCARQMLAHGIISCPFDRKETQVQNVEDLPKNYALMEFIGDSMEQIDEVAGESDGKTICNENSSHLATKFCATCDVDLCDRCWKLVHQTKTHSHHTKIPLCEKPAKLLMCKAHPGSVAEFFCTEPFCPADSKTMCIQCTQKCPHENHQYMLIQQKIEGLRTSLWANLRRVNGRCTSMARVSEYYKVLRTPEGFEKLCGEQSTRLRKFKEQCDRMLAEISRDMGHTSTDVHDIMNELYASDEHETARGELRSKISALLTDLPQLLDKEYEVKEIGEASDKIPDPSAKVTSMIEHSRIDPVEGMLCRNRGMLEIDTTFSGDSGWVKNYIQENCGKIHPNKLLFKDNVFELVEKLPNEAPERRTCNFRRMVLTDIPSIPSTLKMLFRRSGADKTLICITDYEGRWQWTEPDEFYSRLVRDYCFENGLNFSFYSVLDRKEEFGIVLNECLTMY